MQIRPALIFSVLLWLPLGTPALAETPRAPGFLPQIGFDDGLDAGVARAAMLRGEILPLDRILAQLRAAFPGEIIEIQLELEDGSFVYEFDILSPDGRLFEVELDAATGQVIEIEEGDDDD
ncbi:PepSY domain-containing protein [Xinfangfangia sp. D13-10-4-6]|uniref:PepSY domain-containing protein n=1 Tax=Pseudogemmobacter hezensis TaxID=2737662 RepID=UPI0015578652|nr:PepSY domain-containing protein [Pseudogemmobacter hezensis]NPD16824.1 PepSY domain-containing protein [Pseudogemmobacter hezensis]